MQPLNQFLSVNLEFLLGTCRLIFGFSIVYLIENGSSYFASRGKIATCYFGTGGKIGLTLIEAKYYFASIAMFPLSRFLSEICWNQGQIFLGNEIHIELFKKTNKFVEL